MCFLCSLQYILPPEKKRIGDEIEILLILPEISTTHPTSCPLWLKFVTSLWFSTLLLIGLLLSFTIADLHECTGTQICETICLTILQSI